MNQIIKKSSCCGCGACVAICPQECIEMIADDEGFLYPKINTNICVGCDSCRHVCPALKKNGVVEDPFHISYAANCCDEKTRENSSSGGIFTLLADEVLLRDGIVFGAAFSNDYRAVEHIAISRSEDLDKLRGSKYVQSILGNTYQQVKGFLDDGRSVMFSGTPCQVEGLKSYLGKEYDHLLCVDLICHGVPSPKVWKTYLAFREQCADSSVDKVSFRNKVHGWKNYSVAFEFANKTQYRVCFSEDLFMKTFLSNICLRPSCGQCWAKGINRKSDITLADFWGVENVVPKMYDDKGTSLVLIHSKKGFQWFESINSKMEYEKVGDTEIALKYNLSAVQSSEFHNNRKELFLRLKDTPFDQLVFDLVVTETLECRWVRDNICFLKCCNNVYVYGAGMIAKRVVEALKIYEVDIAGVIVTDISSSCRKVCNHNVRQFSDVVIDSENDVIVLAVSEENQSQILPTLYEKKIRNILCFRSDG